MGRRVQKSDDERNVTMTESQIRQLNALMALSAYAHDQADITNKILESPASFGAHGEEIIPLVEELFDIFSELRSYCNCV
ncbi:MAG: hypothetical protein LBU30_04730, partial [Candidatus Methanoplasma sp.]|nr:hypothetical protein [Candidatus Methanoplasma sp.]